MLRALHYFGVTFVSILGLVILFIGIAAVCALVTFVQLVIFMLMIMAGDPGALL